MDLSPIDAKSDQSKISSISKLCSKSSLRIRIPDHSKNSAVPPNKISSFRPKTSTHQNFFQLKNCELNSINEDSNDFNSMPLL